MPHYRHNRAAGGTYCYPAAWAGKDDGSSDRGERPEMSTRISKIGNATLRAALFTPAMVSMRSIGKLYQPHVP